MLHLNSGAKIEIDWACDIILGDLSDHAKFKVLKLYNVQAGEKLINKTLKNIIKCKDNIKKGIDTQKDLDELELLHSVQINDQRFKIRVNWFVQNARKNVEEVKMKERMAAKEKQNYFKRQTLKTYKEGTPAQQLLLQSVVTPKNDNKNATGALNNIESGPDSLVTSY